MSVSDQLHSVMLRSIHCQCQTNRTVSVSDQPHSVSVRPTTTNTASIRETFNSCILGFQPNTLDEVRVNIWLQFGFETDVFVYISGLGMIQPCGHADFYVNGGHDQPGCKQGPISSLVQYGLLDGNYNSWFYNTSTMPSIVTHLYNYGG